jgi:hypothetical protein
VARVLRDIVEDEGLTRHEHPAGDTGRGRKSHPDELLLALARNGLEHELARVLVEQEDGGGARVEDRTRDVDDRLQERAMALLGRKHPRRDRLPVAAFSRHGVPPVFVAVR